MKIYDLAFVAKVNQGELWDHIFVLLDRKEQREKGSRGNGCLKKRERKKKAGEKRKTLKKSIIKIKLEISICRNNKFVIRVSSGIINSFQHRSR